MIKLINGVKLLRIFYWNQAHDTEKTDGEIKRQQTHYIHTNIYTIFAKRIK